MQDIAKSSAPSAPWACACGVSPLFRAMRMSYQPTQLGLATLTVLALWLIGVVLDSMWPKESSVPVMTTAAGCNDELGVYLSNGFSRAAAEEFTKAASKPAAGATVTFDGPFATMYRHMKLAVHEMTAAIFSARLIGEGGPTLFGAMAKIPAAVLWLFERHILYGILYFLLALAAGGLLGGAAYRAAAVNATRDESVDFVEALKFARSRYAGFVLSPLLPLAPVVGVALVVWFCSVIATVQVINILAAIFWILALLAGLVMAVLMLGYLTAWPLWFPTVAVEGSDVFEAFSRSYSFVFGKPWRGAFYALLSLIYGVLCFVFVKFFVWLLLWLVHLTVGWGVWGTLTPAGGQAMPTLEAMWKMPAAPGLPSWSDFGFAHLSGTYKATSFLMACWTMLVVLAVAAFGVSFFISSSTLIYLLLRRDVDGTDIEEVWTEEGDSEPPTAAAPAAAAPAAPGSVATLPVVGAGGAGA